MDVELCREVLADRPEARAKLRELHRGYVEARFAEAFSKFPSFPQLEFEPFLDRVLRSASERVLRSREPSARVRDVLEAVHYADLVLACAMAAGEPLAWDVFGSRFGEFLRRAATRLTNNPALADEIGGEILGDLFFTDRADGRSRISSYTGASSLERWLWLVLRHRIVDALRGRKNEISLEDSPAILDGVLHAPGNGDSHPSASAEERALDQQRQALLATVIPAAFADLAPRARSLLKLVFLDGARQRQVAAVYAVHESQISRWIDRACREVMKNAIHRLTKDHGLDYSEASELVAQVKEGDLGVGLSKLLEGPNRKLAGEKPPSSGVPSRRE